MTTELRTITMAPAARAISRVSHPVRTSAGFKSFQRRNRKAPAVTTMEARNASKSQYTEAPASVKACTDASPRIPLRVRKVLYTTSKKETVARTKFVRWNFPVRRCARRVWISAIEVSHGTRDEFSTGSQPQYPPQPSTPYAQ